MPRPKRGSHWAKGAGERQPRGAQEVSALCVRRDRGEGEELLAVGDEDYVVLTAALRGDELASTTHGAQR